MLVHPLSLHGQVPEFRMHQLGSAELQRSATPAGTGNAFNIQRTADDGPILWRVRVTPNRRNAR